MAKRTIKPQNNNSDFYNIDIRNHYPNEFSFDRNSLIPTENSLNNSLIKPANTKQIILPLSFRHFTPLKEDHSFNNSKNIKNQANRIRISFLKNLHQFSDIKEKNSGIANINRKSGFNAYEIAPNPTLNNSSSLIKSVNEIHQNILHTNNNIVQQKFRSFLISRKNDKK